MSSTLRVMADIAKRHKDKAEREAPRAGMKAADVRYVAAVSADIQIVLEWLAEREEILTKQWKGDVPWKAKGK